ncbi:DUF6752 domain-containing protein [Nocardioides sp. GCM10027113]|uniref:DUF6752 domain-containing protein n=1 Tax=unclassified Nocardioides TaxID=2615069 RepID=UPI00360D6835
MQLRDLRPGASADAVRRLEQRVADLEADMAEMRRHNLRLAELVDVVQELLVPVATRDEAAVQEAVEQFRKSL